MSSQSRNNIDTHSQNSGVKKERQHTVKKHEIPRRTRSNLHICNADKSCQFQRRNIKNLCSEVRRRPENPNPWLEVAAVQFAPLSVVAAGILHGEDSRLIA
jgi:hypothetical protein